MNRTDRHYRPPRKVTVATVMWSFQGLWHSPEARIAELKKVLSLPGQEILKADLIVFPECALTAGRTGSPEEKALSLAGAVEEGLGRLAEDLCSYLIVPMFLQEGKSIANAAVLFDRQGQLAGIYRKLNPVAAIGARELEEGILPGTEVPVFDCDFGRIGIQMCWDMSVEEGWSKLARQGAELVAVPSASPQTVRPASYAMRHRYYVVTSTPRDNVSVFNPVGLVEAQRLEAGLLVHTLDLNHAVLHWSEALDEGRAFEQRYGERAGFVYSTREDTGVFWSNDPECPIDEMIRELGLETMDEQIARCRRLRGRVLSSRRTLRPSPATGTGTQRK